MHLVQLKLLLPLICFRLVFGFVPSGIVRRTPASSHVLAAKAKSPFEVYNIDRDWHGGIKSMKVNVISPSSNSKGVAFFMHGFSQYPEAYSESLEKLSKDLGITIIAVETGVTSDQVFHGICESIKHFKFPPLQEILQGAVAEDTLQCIRMVRSGSAPFQGIPQAKMAVFGHSMGGGLTYYVAAEANVQYAGSWAPVPGADKYKPKTALESFVPVNNLLVQGSWDIVARGEGFKPTPEIVYWELEHKNAKNVVFADISRGVHTGFEDSLVLFRFSLSNVLTLLVALISANPLTWFDKISQLVALRQLLSKSQLAVSANLMEYLFSCMLSNRSVSPVGAKAFLDADVDLKPKWIDSVSFEEPEPLNNK